MTRGPEIAPPKADVAAEAIGAELRKLGIAGFNEALRDLIACKG